MRGSGIRLSSTWVVDYWAQWSNDCEIHTVTVLYCLMVACTTVKGCTCLLFIILIQWNLSIKDTPNKGHLSNEDTVSCPNHIELCTNLRTSELGTPLYTGQPAGSQWCPL